MVGVAVKVTFVPAHSVVALATILTLADKFGFTITITTLDGLLTLHEVTILLNQVV